MTTDAVDRIADIITSTGRDIGIADDVLAQIAGRAADFIRRTYGGRAILIPELDKDSRDAYIKKHFNGRNLGEIQRLTGLSRSSIYRIYRGE